MICDVCHKQINDNNRLFRFYQTDSGNIVCPDCCCLLINGLSCISDAIDKTVDNIINTEMKGKSFNDHNN